jgi:hypothetical protein
MIKSSSVAGGSFAPTLQFENSKYASIPSFPNFDLSQNLSPPILANPIIASPGRT